MEAAEHPKQAARLAALRGYEILDTPEEEAFDEITQLASEICETPISVVNLIDAGRQWFKAEVGLGVRETPLATSLCSHAILEEDFVEIPDTLEDARMRDNPLCVGAPGLRFYAGALLKTAEGLPLGTLCVLDHRPRRLTPLQRNALQVLARQVMARLDLRLALKRQRLMLKEIDHRVKNSLAAIMAVIRIQLRGSEDEGVNAALRDVETRIGRIALLHEQLYRASSAHEIDFADYIVRVGEMLRGSIPDSIRIETEADPVPRRRAAGLPVRGRHDGVRDELGQARLSRRPPRIDQDRAAPWGGGRDRAAVPGRRRGSSERRDHVEGDRAAADAGFRRAGGGRSGGPAGRRGLRRRGARAGAPERRRGGGLTRGFSRGGSGGAWLRRRRPGRAP
jgi:two-component sensor histidine kinase